MGLQQQDQGPLNNTGYILLAGQVKVLLRSTYVRVTACLEHWLACIAAVLLPALLHNSFEGNLLLGNDDKPHHICEQPLAEVLGGTCAMSEPQFWCRARWRICLLACISVEGSCARCCGCYALLPHCAGSLWLLKSNPGL